MTKTQNFVVWLDGFISACGTLPSEEQVRIIKEKLNDLFDHVAEPPKTILNKKQESITHKKRSSGFPFGDEDIVYKC